MGRLGRLALSTFALTLASLGPAPAQAARTISPDDFLASPGAQAFRAQRYGDALAGFRSLLQQHPDDVLVLRYIGITLTRQKRYAEAIETLERARALAADDPAVLFFLGAAQFNAGQRREAAATMARVRSLAPGTAYAERAGRYLQALGQLEAEQAPLDAPKPWSLSLQVGTEYDDNIIVAPDSFAGETDGFRIFERANGSYDALDEGPWRVTADATTFHSQHTDDAFDELDLGTYGAGLTGRYAGRLDDVPFALSLRYGFDLVVLDGDVFSSTHSLRSSAFANWSPYALSQAYHEVQFGNYRDDGFNPAISSRNATLNAFGLRQYVFFENRRHYLWLGYAYRRNDAEGTNFEYRGHVVSGGAAATLPWDVHLSLSAEYVSEDYIKFLGIESRDTDRLTLSLLLSKRLWEDLRLTIGYARTDENSTIEVLDFERGVTTVSLIYEF